jgi:peptide/nickel transport system substrate-binding protein
MSLRRSVILLLGSIFGLALLAGCSQKTPIPPPPTSVPTLTPTHVPLRQLTVCLGQEPASLYPMDNPSLAARSVLAAVYDGPIDTNSYGYQPVILTDLPSVQNGDAQLFAQSVNIGDEVVDASGTPITLGVGAMIRPAGCHDDTCVVKYDGTAAIQMDQMQATFNILPGLTWSDGEPVTADDSVYAYQVAIDSASPSSRYLLDRTKSYEATDVTTVQWWGKPGFVDPTYFINFWSPLPKHLWSKLAVDQLSKTDESSRTPVGWGPFVIKEWVAGDHITLFKNPRYFRAAEGLPKFDILTFRFETGAGAAISDLLAGTCDILDPSVQLDGQAALLLSMADKGQIQAYFTTMPVMEGLAIGIQPASYDNGTAPRNGRIDYFSDVRVRQALALCLDRQQVVDTVLSGLSVVPTTYVPMQDPLYNPDVSTYSFNVTAAGNLLDLAGWKDTDQNPSTPRQAKGVPGIPDGTRFEVNYVTTSAVQRQQASMILAASLAQCGIKVNVQYLDANTFYAPGPGGALFGRNFDLAEFAMGTTGSEPPCDWYTSAEVPAAANSWVGTNVSGYRNPAFDTACQAAQNSIPDDPAHATAFSEAQLIFSNDLPVIPLYWRVNTAASRVNLCQFSLDPTASSNLWNIETFDSGTGCQP